MFLLVIAINTTYANTTATTVVILLVTTEKGNDSPIADTADML